MPTPDTFDFDANSQPWYQSNVQLNEGDRFKLDVNIKQDLKYTGSSVEHARSLDGAWVDHTHLPKKANNEYLAQGLWADGIIGRIGEGSNVPGDPFDVVTGNEYVADASGYLQITVNEKTSDDHSNNQGQLGFTVTILSRASQGKLLVAKYGSDQARVPRGEKSRQYSSDIDVEPASLEIIYDSSGSMKWVFGAERDPVQGEKSRREAALEAFGHLLDSGLLEETKVALRVFGPPHDGTNIVSTSSYASTLVSPLTDFSVTHGGELFDIVKGLSPEGGTPIGASLRKAKEDLEGATGVSVVTLLTDGIANDQNDVKAAADDLENSVKLVLNIVGFSLSDTLKQTYRELAATHNGTFVSIDEPDEATTNLETAVGLSFEILKDGNKIGGRYNVGGPAIDLDPGSYTLRMLIPNNNTDTSIEVEAGKTTLIETLAG